MFEFLASLLHTAQLG